MGVNFRLEAGLQSMGSQRVGHNLAAAQQLSGCTTTNLLCTQQPEWPRYERNVGDFPGSPVVKTPCSQYRQHGFNPWLGNYDPTGCKCG